MPYKQKEDKATQMRKYRREKKLQNMSKKEQDKFKEVLEECLLLEYELIAISKELGVVPPLATKPGRITLPNWLIALKEGKKSYVRETPLLLTPFFRSFVEDFYKKHDPNKKLLEDLVEGHDHQTLKNLEAEREYLKRAIHALKVAMGKRK